MHFPQIHIKALGSNHSNAIQKSKEVNTIKLGHKDGAPIC
jgi:hypothetical protein